MDRLVEALVDTMDSLAHDELWSSLSDELRALVGAANFDHWIEPLRVISTSGPVVRLSSASSFVLDFIRKRLFSSLYQAVRNRLGEEARIELILSGECPEKPAVASAPGAPAADLLPAPAGAVHSPAPTRGPQPADAAGDFSLETFVVGDANRLAYNAVLEVIGRPGGHFNPLYIHGPSGAGKTHLVRGLHRALRSRRRGGGPLRVSYLTAEQFFQHYGLSIQQRTLREFQERYRSLDVLILDDVHLLGTKKKTQIELLHTFISLADAGRQVVLTSDVPPGELKALDPDLVGRFASGLRIGMKRPDFATRVGIARAQGRTLSLSADESVYRFVAENVSGSAREILGAVKLLYHCAQVRGLAVDVTTAQEVLGDYLRDRARRVDAERIVGVVSEYYGVTPAAMASPGRERQTTLARQVAMHLIRHYTRKSLAEVGKYFGNRSHPTVKSALRRISTLLQEEDGLFAATMAVLREKLEG